MIRPLSALVFGLLTLAGCMNAPVPMDTRAESTGEALAQPSDGVANENEVE